MNAISSHMQFTCHFKHIHVINPMIIIHTCADLSNICGVHHMLFASTSITYLLWNDICCLCGYWNWNTRLCTYNKK